MNKHIGSDFNDFLMQENMLGEVEAEAMKRVIAYAIQNYIDENAIKKSKFAKQMQTSRSQLDRLLDPDNTSLNLKSLAIAAAAMGKHIEIRISD
jgi:antitoxin HicB